MKNHFFLLKKIQTGKLILCLCLLIVGASTQAWAVSKKDVAELAQQAKTVKGQVVDESGEPLIGVSVYVKGTTTGTITDFDGNFSVTVPSGATTLEISYIGYTTQSVTIGNNTQFNIRMQPDAKTLDEVVVIGYGTVKKRDLTGAVVSVKSEDITLNPGSNPMQSLQGKVAGLDITRESGQAGEGVKMQLRGNRSFTADGNPTFIIDGMPGDYSTLNPNDIESIEVLKDASSTAMYGSAGANGVVIITTKQGQAGKTTVNFNAFAGINGWSKTPKMRSGDSYLQALRDANAATGNWSSAADDEKIFSSAEAYQAHQRGEYLDWADMLLGDGLTQNYSVSISGGTEKTKAYLSLNFADEKGQYKGDEYKVYSTNIRVDHQVKKWLNIGANMQASYVHQNRAYARLTNALVSSPLGKAYNEDGSVNITPLVSDESVISLLLNQDQSVYRNQNQNFKVYFNPYIELKPLKGLSIISRVGAAIEDSRNNYFQGMGSYQYYTMSGAASTGTNSNVYAQVKETRNYNYKWENIVTYNFTLLDDHDFTVTGVTTWNHNRRDIALAKQDNITDNKYMWHNIGGTNSSSETEYQMSKGMGYIGRVSYSYKGRYLLSGSVRRDGSSRLAKDNRWSTFPAVSAGWRISDEAFMQNTSEWLSNLKLRVGYGVTGTASIDPYSSSANLEQSQYQLGGQLYTTYLFSKNYANPNLTWEKSYNTNIGLDAAFLNNRIDLTADYYFTKTDGVIWARNLPVVNGAYNASTYYLTNMNICETENRGIELALNTRNIDTKDFKWNSTITFTYNKEKITGLTDGVSDHIQKTNTDYYLNIGYPVNSFYGLKKTGIWQKDEAADAAVFGYEPGYMKFDVPGLIKESDGKWYKVDEETGEKIYYDKDNRYSIGTGDYQVLGHNSPDWTLGFQNTLFWKDFDLSIFAYARWGQMINYDLLGFFDPTGSRNYPKAFSYWTESNPTNDFPAMNVGVSNGYSFTNALNYVDGSFIKIKNITLGYTLPKKLIKKAGLEKCRFYGTITNPFIFAKSDLLKDYDPEMNGSLNYPLTKQLVFGVNVSF
ncbi:TonB-dependent receptor [Bacteroides sp. 51]|uniref:SusC/RagA family TonB-linked outer membrane protein n=1 Tax=Bacteroides sp. 51 TaxID=2302938 RepID=UPI0013D1DC1B|nr:TonB-dependent receptor [Bacteroides sp. 51]NDV80633.1 TonB-dependent receptor [Bacteroides sp. 51]